jgi:hypothetical protein
LWQELLQVERVGRTDNFFELGGHSLLAVTLAERLRQALKCSLSLKDLHDASTLEQLATRVDLVKWVSLSAHSERSELRESNEEHIF